MLREFNQAARRCASGFLFLALLDLAGCATLQWEGMNARRLELPARVELSSTPFFPQEDFQCGPAALATVLATSGVEVTPDSLTSEVYLPARQGSLQVELLAATRRHGRVPYVLQPQLSDALREIAAGHPVLVLQNLGLSWLPRWHYAVLVGFDLERGEVVLRSGRNERHVVTLALFERTWERAAYWALVIVPLDQLPATAEELSYVRAVSELERMSRIEEASLLYRGAVGRWPQSTAARLGLGNTLYAAGHTQEAEQTFREVVATHPDFAPAWNNLAQVLAEAARWEEAEEAAARAVRLGGAGRSAYEQTLTEIRARALNIIR